VLNLLLQVFACIFLAKSFSYHYCCISSFLKLRLCFSAMLAKIFGLGLATQGLGLELETEALLQDI